MKILKNGHQLGDPGPGDAEMVTGSGIHSLRFSVLSVNWSAGEGPSFKSIVIDDKVIKL